VQFDNFQKSNCPDTQFEHTITKEKQKPNCSDTQFDNFQKSKDETSDSTQICHPLGLQCATSQRT